MHNYIQPGDYGLPIIAPAAVTAGQLVIVGAAIVGVAACDAAAGATVAIATEGVYDLAKNPPDAMAAGDVAKVTVTGSIGTVAAAGTTAIGWVVQAAAAGATTARVRLVPTA
jgi:predicted RecA/RadA family phage recombinase